MASLHLQHIVDSKPFCKAWLKVCSDISLVSKSLQFEKAAEKFGDCPILMKMIRLQKFHLIIHMCEIYREVMRDEQKREAAIEAAMKEVGLERQKVVEKLEGFELDTNSILCHAMRFLMVQQRSNLENNLKHCSMIIKDCLRDDESATAVLASGPSTSSFSALKQLWSTTQHISSFEEERMMMPIQKFGLVSDVINLLHKRMSNMRTYALAASVCFLDVCFDSEAYSADPDHFLESKEDKKKLVALKDYILTGMIKAKVLKKRPRHLLRVISRCERQVGKVDIDKSLAEKLQELMIKSEKIPTDGKKTSLDREALKYSKKKKMKSIIFS